jgi:hypothetical protein
MLGTDEAVDGLGIQEAARRFGVNEQTLRRWIWRGKVKASRIGQGRACRWHISGESPEIRSTEYCAVDTVPAAVSVGDPLTAPSWPSGAKSVKPSSGRLHSVEVGIEDELVRLSTDASAIQEEIERLRQSLSVLRAGH